MIHRTQVSRGRLHNHARASCLLKVVAQLYDRDGVKHTGFVQDKLTMLERVDVALDEQKVGAALYRQESAPWNIDAVSCHVNER